MMDHYHVTLDGFPADSGYVVTKDGEIIGTYTFDDNEVLGFLPTGSSEPAIGGVMVGPFCRQISEWHKAQQDNQ